MLAGHADEYDRLYELRGRYKRRQHQSKHMHFAWGEWGGLRTVWWQCNERIRWQWIMNGIIDGPLQEAPPYCGGGCLGALVILGATLSGLFTPGWVSQGKPVLSGGGICAPCPWARHPLGPVWLRPKKGDTVNRQLTVVLRLCIKYLDHHRFISLTKFVMCSFFVFFTLFSCPI